MNTNDGFSEQFLAIEVEELTELVRTSKVYAHMRRCLIERGLIPTEITLGGLVETETNVSLGAFRDNNGRYVEFEYDDENGFRKWNEIRDPFSLIEKYPAIAVLSSR